MVDGVVTAKGKGKATITVTTEDGNYTSTCEVNVKVAVLDVTLNETLLDMSIGDTETLVATVLPENATNKNVFWSSSDDDVATVVDGVVTAKGNGEATITVTTEDGDYTATCDVVVNSLFSQVVKPEMVEGSSFVYDGKTFYYLDEVIEYNGKKYFKIFNNKNWVQWNKTDAHYLMTERPTGGLYIDIKHASTTGTDLQDMDTDFGVFGDYKIPSDYEWDCGTMRYNDENVIAYLKGTINLPSLEDYKYLINQGVPFPYDGSQIITSSLFTYNGNTHRNQLNGTNAGNSLLLLSDDKTYYKGQNNAKYNFVTYISEDFFVENEIDLSTAGEILLTAIKDNIPREKMAEGVWTDLKLQLLYDEQYEGEGLGITADTEKSGNDITVNVVLHNNGAEAVGAGNNIIVALYSENIFVDLAVVSVTTNVNANSITTAIPITITASIPATEIKVMLWDGTITAKPFATTVAIDL